MADSDTGTLPQFHPLATPKSQLFALLKSRTPLRSDTSPDGSFNCSHLLQSSAAGDSAFVGSTLGLRDKKRSLDVHNNNSSNSVVDGDSLIQGTSLLSAEGVSRYSEPVSAVFATPKARLFQLLKSNSLSTSRARLSLSHDDRTSATPQREDTQNCAADTSFSCGFDLLSPLHHDERDDDDDCHSIVASRETAADSRAADSRAAKSRAVDSRAADSRAQSLFTSDEDEACGAKDNRFRKPSTSQQPVTLTGYSDDCKTTECSVDVTIHNSSRRNSLHDTTLTITKSLWAEELDQWSLVLRNEAVCLEGFRNGSRRRHTTKPVVCRLTCHVVQTSTGSRYRLIGPIQRPSSGGCNPSLPMDVLVLFKHGFPWNWIEVLQVAAEESWSVTRRSSMPSELSALKIVPRSLSKSKAVVSDDEGCVQRSRHSGRLLLPPLAFWAGQRVIVSHKPGTANQYIQGHDVLVDSQSAAVSFSQMSSCSQQNEERRPSKTRERKRKRSRIMPSLKAERTECPRRPKYHCSTTHVKQAVAKFDSLNTSTLEIALMSDMSDVEPDSDHHYSDEN